MFLVDIELIGLVVLVVVAICGVGYFVYTQYFNYSVDKPSRMFLKNIDNFENEMFKEMATNFAEGKLQFVFSEVNCDSIDIAGIYIEENDDYSLEVFGFSNEFYIEAIINYNNANPILNLSYSVSDEETDEEKVLKEETKMISEFVTKEEVYDYIIEWMNNCNK